MGDKEERDDQTGPLEIKREDQVTQGVEVDPRELHDDDEDVVQEASEDSFPTSDPPAYRGRGRGGSPQPVPPEEH